MTNAELERTLLEVGERLDYPAMAGLAARVRAAIEEPAARSAREARRALRPRPSLRRAVALAAAALLALAGAALATRFVVRGVEIVFRDEPRPAPTRTPPPAGPLGQELFLGKPATLEEAREAVAFPVRAPAALGTPDEVWLDDEPAGGRVTLLYRARPGLPASGVTGVGLLLTQFVAEVGQPTVGKEFGTGTLVEEVRVGDGRGGWLEGEPHTVLYLDQDGSDFPDSVRLSGNTLLWNAGEVTLRLEAEITKAEALRIAGTIGPPSV